MKQWTEYYYFVSGLSEATCDLVEQYAKLLPEQQGIVSENAVYDKKIRESKIRWFNNNRETCILFDLIGNIIRRANDMTWEFDLHGFDSIQYSEYSGKTKGHYDFHMDFGGGSMMTRKVSIAIQLSDPNTYKGGNFEFRDININDDMKKLLRNRGTCIVFPSFMSHRVTPVTSGIRKSLVAWMEGPNYR